MKWFRHETDGPTSEEITRLIELTGFAGKGRWYTLKELVAAKMDHTDRCHAEYSALEWGRFLGLKQKKLKTFLKHCENIFNIFLESRDDIIKISIPKLLEERDFYSKRFEQKKENVRPKIEIQIQKDTPPPPSRGIVRGTRLDPAIKLTEEWRQIAVKCGLNGSIQVAFDSFVDYWVSRAGKEATKLDWTRTWRNRCRDLAAKPQNQKSSVKTVSMWDDPERF